MLKIRLYQLALVFCIPLAAGCGDSNQRATGPLAAIGSGGDSIFDVPTTQVALPPEPRLIDTDDDALEGAVQSVGGLAVVAFKNPASLRLREAGGRRAAIPARQTREGLALLGAAGAEVLRVYGMSAMAYVHLPPGTAAALRHSPNVDFVEPVRTGGPDRILVGLGPSMRSATRAPSTALSQITPWGITMVHAPNAWTITRGSSAKVMIISSGVNVHPDLPAVPSGNCGGYFNSCSSRFSNGTIFAGIVAALDNSIGVVGVAPSLQGANLYSWRIYDDSAQTNWNLYLAGLNAAPQMGIKVVYTDVVYVGYWPPEATAIAAAWAAGTIVVAGVGDNAAYKTDVYPAAYPNVVGVSGVKDDGTSATSAPPGCTVYPGSNYGPMVDVAAPYWAYSTATFSNLNPTYIDTKAPPLGWCANDIAAAHVVGVLALLEDLHPTWTPDQIVQRVLSTASLGGTRNDYLGHGIVDAAAAVGPPPLTNYINAQPPYYYAEPSGGYPPYTYLWEWCAINCGGGGGNAPAVFRETGPKVVGTGWQYLSNSSWVYWTMSRSTLRSTVTDSQNGHAVDTYTVP